MKKFLALLLVMVLAMGMMAGCGNSEDTDTEETTGETGSEVSEDGEEQTVIESDFEDKVVFRVNDTDVMLSSVNVLVYQIKSYYESIYGPTVWDMDATETMKVDEFVKNDIQDLVLRSEILRQEAEKEGLTLTEEKKTELLDQSAQIFASFSDEAKAKYGFTQEIVDQLILDQGLSEVVFEDMTKDLTFTDEQLDEILMTNTQYVNMLEYGVENYYEQVRARHILISTLDDSGQPLGEEEYDAALAKIEDLRQRALDGEDFAELATNNTEDPGSVETGGEYTFGRGQMVTEFENGAYNLEVGEISDVIETQYGFHIIKLEERIAATDEEVQAGNDLLVSIKDDAEYQLRLEQFEEMYEVVALLYETEVISDVWGAVELADPTEEAAE